MNITTVTSPNHSSRDGRPIRYLIVHATVGSLHSSLGWLCSPKSKVSAHYVIAKAGTIYQLVPDDRTAWHAGRSNYQGDTRINEGSIGIELENRTGMKGFRGQDPYPLEQLDALITLCRAKMAAYDIPASRVLSHAEVAVPRGRKTDPLGLDWALFRARLLHDPWDDWGREYPLDEAAREHGIPRFWLPRRALLGAATSDELPLGRNGEAITAFERGWVLWDGTRAFGVRRDGTPLP